MTMRARSGVRMLALVACGAVLGGAAWQSLGTGALAQRESGAVPLRVATLDVLAVVERVVLSEQYTQDREALTTERSNAVDAIRKAMSDLEGRAKLLPQDSPELKALQQQYTQAQQAAREATDKALADIEALNLRQLSEAYARVNEAAKTFAREQGYSHVLTTRVGDLAFRSDNVSGAVQEMIARGVVVSPQEDDITQRLIEQLGVADVRVDVPGLAPAPAGAR